MRKNIKLPAPQLSQLKEIDVELDMNGQHYLDLATSEGRLPEEIALSIVNSLAVQDANKLTMAELRYVFMLIKINSLENKYTATIKCTIPHNGKVCGCQNTYPILLSDADLNCPDKDYKPPVIEFITGNKMLKYKVLPPPVDLELALFDWFLSKKGIPFSKIDQDKSTLVQYNFMRAVMHLVDTDNQRLIKDNTQFDSIMDYLEQNKYQTIISLNNAVIEVNSFGVQNKTYLCKCKECGGTLKFQLPLLHGLSV